MQNTAQPTQDQVLEVVSQGWYVVTPAGPEGPLATEEEAQRYLRMLSRVSAARQVLGCLEPRG